MDHRPFNVDTRLLYGGQFLCKNDVTIYDKGILHLKCGVWSNEVNVKFLRDLAEKFVKGEYELWYRKPGRNLNNGRAMLVSEIDVISLLHTRCPINTVTVYVTIPLMPSNSSSTVTKQPSPKMKRLNVGINQVSPLNTGPSSFGTQVEKKPNLKAHPNLNAQMYQQYGLEIPTINAFKNPTFTTPSQKIPCTMPSDLILRKSPKHHRSEYSQTTSTTHQLSIPKNTSNFPKNTANIPKNVESFIPSKQTTRPGKLSLRTSKRCLKFDDTVDLDELFVLEGLEEVVEEVSSDRGKGKTSEAVNKGKAVVGIEDVVRGINEHEVRDRKGKRVQSNKKGKAKVAECSVSKQKKNTKQFESKKPKVRYSSKKKRRREVREVVDEEFTDSELSDNDAISDPEWVNDEFDNGNIVQEVFCENNEGLILDTVENSLGFEVQHDNGPYLWGVDDLEIRAIEEIDEESDELRSLQGSDNDDVDPYSSFNKDNDFNGNIVLKVGLKFESNIVFRKALVHHSVQNGYDFFYSHNGSKRVTAYCKDKCNCEWNSKRSKIGSCTCEAKNPCRFKVHATKMRGEETFQIKSLYLKHTCKMSQYNRKVGSEYLAEKFLEFFRTNIDWKIKSFQTHVLKEIGVHVSYMKCWLARARAKLIIYGNGKDQYGRVWDYAAVLRKYNPGSSSFVVCDGIDRPPPFFKRIYICLKACKEGFIKGCIPFIGVDGCHLKGAYPGMCLVVVGMDGNNNIYPVAWAVVEVENTETWTWFLELLCNDIEAIQGEGMTFMSDRQKGLVDALKTVAPKAEVRYCVRHIWANFKLNFSGQIFKDIFWRAARASTKAEFDDEMATLKNLSTEAWAYLDVIPPKHWSRHAFLTQCKSNMLLNNVCETFNVVLKEVRDKPILTHMEWMRRYVMKRNCDKREGVEKYEERLMPYVKKYLEWGKKESRFATLSRGEKGHYEVDLRGDSAVVNLNEKKCGCRKWDLTGLPCPHAMAAILVQRMEPEDFVDEAYTKEKYLLAYGPVVYPMPGVKHWERSGLPEPLPPPSRKMPGRPSAKKRKKEAGKGKKIDYVKRPKKPNKCGNCGQMGHSKRTCKNPNVPPTKERQAEGRPQLQTEWAKEAREKVQKRKTTKETYRRQGRSSTITHTIPQSPTTFSSNFPLMPSTSFTELLTQASSSKPL